MSLELHNHIFGWSQLGIESDKVVHHKITMSKDELGYVKLLNRFASLLVSEPEEKAAATGWFSADTLRILWTKDVEATAADISYASTLPHRIANESHPVHALRAIIPRCKARMHRCARELVELFEPIDNRTNLWLWYEKYTNDMVADALLEHNLIGTKEQVIEALDDFIKVASDLENQSEDVISNVLVMAGILASETRISHYISPDQAQALRDLGVYYRAVVRISSFVKRLRANKVKINIHYVNGPKTQSLSVKAATLDALKTSLSAELAQEKFSPTFDQLRQHYSTASPGKRLNHEINLPCTQHPFVTICLEMMQLHLNQIYLGASSSSCCQWCDDWITAASSVLKIKIHRYDSHRDYPVGWLLPPEAPVAVTNAMASLLKERIDCMFRELKWRFIDSPASDDVQNQDVQH